MKLFISPHNDDETLFGAFTLMREKPLVVIVTDSHIQFNRGNNITAEQRWQETVIAMRVLDCPVMRLGVRDDVVDEWLVREQLRRFSGFEEVYAPAIQGGNPHHDIIGAVAKELFPMCKQYTTYSKTELYTTGSIEIDPTTDEIAKKFTAMSCYKSQKSLQATAPHFEAVRGRSEWLI